MRSVVLAGLLIILCFSVQNANADTWRIHKDHWSEADELGFGSFVHAIGESNCSSSESCLRDPANPYRMTDQRFLDIDVDCAKWAYLLRAYYAWKNNLPFGYVNGVSGQGNERFSREGNKLLSRRDLIDRGSGIDGPTAIHEMLETVSSGTYRSDPTAEQTVLSDFYSPALRPGTIRAGSIGYDFHGHVVIVYKVDDDGRIYYMGAQPDFTVTRGVYGAQFGQSPLRLGGGLKNWRPFKLVGYHSDEAGDLLGGHMAFAQNDQISDFSIEQYVGTEPNPTQDVTKARFVYNGVELGLYEYMRASVSGGRLSFNPLYELKSTMKSLCHDLNDRARYVDLDVKDMIATKPNPTRLPNNIYDSNDSEWEEYSTPSRDARIKVVFAQFYKDMSNMIDLWVHRDPHIVYDGLSLQSDLRDAYETESKACTITYLNSAKRPVAITFDDMVHRLFALSFDPYQCVELRWGASGEERDSCPDGEAKQKWYKAEQRLRNQVDRTPDIAMGFSIEDLNHAVNGSGVDTPPSVDIRVLIDSMPPRVAFTGMAPLGQ